MNLEQKAQDYLLAHQGESTVSVMVGFGETKMKGDEAVEERASQWVDKLDYVARGGDFFREYKSVFVAAMVGFAKEENARIEKELTNVYHRSGSADGYDAGIFRQWCERNISGLVPHRQRLDEQK